MSVSWTKEQAQVIESRGKNLLVSAAAGSGKTAVLVERIIRLVTEGEQPFDIDRLLVMTFTNAAAAEMRERIGAAIEKKLRENPEDPHLQMQSALVHHAQITTIDSFCLRIIREHFNEIDLDPSFRVGDEGELLLLRTDVMKELLEEYYENGGERFERFVETYASGKGDAGIEDYIMQVYTFSQSTPYPEQWLAQCRAEIGGDGRSEAERTKPAAGEAGCAASSLETAVGEAGCAADSLETAAGEVGCAASSLETTAGEAGCAADSLEPAAGKAGRAVGSRGRVPAWERFLAEDLRKQAGELAQQMKEALSICREEESLCAYEPMFAQDAAHLTALAEAEDFAEMSDILAAFSWGRLAAVRGKAIDPEQKAYVTGCRDRAKKAVAKMKEMYCFAAPEEMEADMNAAGESVEMLLELAEEFSVRFAQRKRERNLVDFNDLEHEALRVLIRLEDGKTVYTDAADELAAQFDEVLVDEYQDSNLVQEALLGAVSGERSGRHNVFLVGDVKQSIYRFRLARPELFLEKDERFEPYEEGNGADKKIALHQNFRSRAEVLDGINDVFYRIMTENLGNIRYTDEAALYPGAVFEPLPEGKTALSPELLLVDVGEEALSGLDADAADFTAKEIEARQVAAKIREMTDPEHGLLVWDKKEMRYRTAQYRDMVILLRSTVGWNEAFLTVLMNEGIPAYAESRAGYFNTIEVETILSLLAVVDNPMQDIPLAAVLKSPIVGMDDREMAEMMIRLRRQTSRPRDRGIYGAMRQCLAGKEEENPSWTGKLREFWELLSGLREKSRYLPIHELIYEIYERTGYYRTVSAMPGGAARRANLDMLVEKASAYEKTSYQGLFHFVRYIENLKRYHTDFGEASTAGEEDDTVRIMSIHKSKGLEFPVVFLAGMGKKFNKRDTYGKILIDPDLGIATDYLDLEHRLKATTLKKNVLRRKMELDSLGEELRVLYVAMTRAKEALVMVGTDRYLGKKVERYAKVPVTDGRIPYTVLGTAGCYLDWLLMAFGSGEIRIRRHVEPLAQIVGGELVRQVQTRQSRAFLETLDRNRVYDADMRNMLETNLNYRYPHEADVRLPMQASVSELKKRREEEEDGQTLFLFAEYQPQPEAVSQASAKAVSWPQPEAAPSRSAKAVSWPQPEAAPLSQAEGMPQTPALQGQAESASWLQPEEMPQASESVPHGQPQPWEFLGGAARGTVYHRILERLPFDRVNSREEAENFIGQLVREERITEEERRLVSGGVIWRFLQSGLGRRMRRAQAEGRLCKERAFVMGVPAREMGLGDSDELVVVQGIIDSCFEEEGGLVLVDYKTDRVTDAAILLAHYRTQLDYYERALEQMTGKPVKEKIIYSLALQKEIPCGRSGPDGSNGKREEQ